MNRLSVFCILFLLMSSSLLAHKDKIITYENGKLIGLPKQYQPAEFDSKKLRLRIKNHVLNISKSAYLNSFFSEGNKYDLQIYYSGSNPRLPSMPPCIGFHIKPLGKDFSYNICFNMDTLDVTGITVVLRTSPNSTRDVNVMLSDIQKKSIADAIEKVAE